ncbi:survival 5'/3'-nucleotidase SurE [Chloropicon primus]|uniref:Survival 5'/3'-nucleotidase SurE n=1 Tax=Chloropicon primus TaxID=1764295 RepID=A0A5B8MID3_9CHLO|nr:survival 5'/3'-nucleotidase SurE [Chloropicon primus]UPQ99417.1 survival 5'/3'-nucleotidase SurE [Chloropicon primus]|eukprot:QDZ20207.1 survival 5'/3'-nucleotidase SurE [Chloropicon primus]
MTSLRTTIRGAKRARTYNALLPGSTRANTQQTPRPTGRRHRAGRGSLRGMATSGWSERDARADQGADQGAGQANPPRRVLLTNDDGPASPFFARFAEGMRRKLNWPTFVCLPDSNWSYVSKSLKPPQSNFAVDLRKDEARVPISPASCVNLGLYELAKDVDFVVSGPNVGHNLGRSSILSSGTVGAALEACIHGRKAVAVSFPFKGYDSWTDDDLESAVDVALEVTEFLWNQGFKEGEDPGSVFYNVNVPLWATSSARDRQKEGKLGMEWLQTSVEQGVGYTSLFKVVDEAAMEMEWSPTGERVFDSKTAKEGGDVAAVRDGHVSITKLHPTLQLAK